jgi:CHASE2 domain-containing sensor protein
MTQLSRSPQTGHVYILYSRQDGVTGAEQLCRSLTQAGLMVWTEIGPEIDPSSRADPALLLITPAALADEEFCQQLSQTADRCSLLLPILWGDLSGEAWQGSLLYERVAERPTLERPLAWLGGEAEALGQHLLARLQEPAARVQPPLPLQASLTPAAERDQEGTYDAFISYGRVDSTGFTVGLHQWLSDRGYRIWFDQTDIPLAVDYQKQIDEGIVRAHNFIFVISPHSANSPYCKLELEQALRLNKRIIPLMHVETISYQTWQERNPGGTEADWQIYQQKGLHSSFANLQRAISRLNWIFCREGIDDLPCAFQNLLELFHRDQEYVQQHTTLLIQALVWERRQRQSSLLLVGPDRLAAQSWLRQQFSDDQQPPCLPTPLHAEYICESQKYADQWMTQVFLAYADADRERQEQVRLSLMLAGFTVWSSLTDIQSGKDFQAEINRGIENADNLVILLSPRALRSLYCLREISYAFELNKRVIPLLIEPINLASLGQGETLPEDAAITLSRLQQLQFIDFSHTQDSEAYQQSLDQLLKRLQDGAQYLREHKELLVQALKWQRQQRNPSILLRGSALYYYEAWIKLALQRQTQQPTALQRQFLQESLLQPADSTLDVFISCAPEDLSFARKLNDILQVQGKTTWALSDSLQLGLNPAEDMQRGLEQCQNGVIVLSPSWLANADCQQQLATAISLNKRLIPVLHRPVVPSKVPEVLAKLPWVDFHRSGRDFLSTFGELYRRLESEPEHVRGHTQLLVRAKTWEEAGRDDSYLLRGRELAAAETWLQQAGDKAPQPIPLQRALIEASHALPRRRIQVRSLLWSTAAVTLLVFALRLLGTLQPLELWTYDLLLRLRPREPQDDRFLLVKVDSESGNWLRQQMKADRYQPSIGTIPDQALDEALATLSAHNPALIGLDFYRDFEAEAVVKQRLAQTPNLVAICKTATEDSPGIEEPREVPLRQVGFNDFVLDNDDFLRRHYLKLEHNSPPQFCKTTEAFSLLLARNYLQQQGTDYVDPWISNGDMQLGSVRVPQLERAQTASYTPFSSDPDFFAGYQTLINFRRSGEGLAEFAEQVSLQDLLTGQVSRGQIEGRIVLIGYTDKSDTNVDSFNTAYGRVPGVVLQGQMTSQLISAALDRRPLIWWLAPEAALPWIGLWALGGGLIVGWAVRPGRLAAAGVGGLVVLVGICYGILVVWAGWMPLVPAALGAAGTAGIVGVLTYRLRHP